MYVLPPLREEVIGYCVGGSLDEALFWDLEEVAFVSFRYLCLSFLRLQDPVLLKHTLHHSIK